jgi:ornithine--oxo-acid transaminase
MGTYLLGQLQQIDSPVVRDVRGRGLFIALEIEPEHATARAVCEALMERGLLSKETHETVVRLAPPLVIAKTEIDWAIRQIREVIAAIDEVRLAS